LWTTVGEEAMRVELEALDHVAITTYEPAPA
jgi:hypothetical protein